MTVIDSNQIDELLEKAIDVVPSGSLYSAYVSDKGPVWELRISVYKDSAVGYPDDAYEEEDDPFGFIG